VVDLGSYTSSMSKDILPQVADPFEETISTASTFTLTVDGEEYDIVPAGATLAELAEAINLSEAAVEATIVNIGPSSAPDYRLSLRSTALGAVAIQLNDESADLLDTISSGTLAEYKVNGQPAVAITSDSRSVTISPGLTVTMLKTGSADITVSHTAAALSTALNSLASAYNAAVDELDQHRGEDAGALEGSSLLYTLSHALRELTSYDSGASGISSLTSLGLEFDDQGKLSLDMTVFSAASSGQFDELAEFLGTSSTDGFLKSAADLMDGLEDSTDGIIKTTISSLQAEMTLQDARIAEEQERIDQLQENLVARMAAADAMIASLEQQVRYMTGLFAAMRSIRDNSL